MKKNLIIALFIILVLFFVATPVEAHFLASDRNIGAVLHVDPNDQPIAGSQTSFFFEFKDKQNKFKAENCDCTFAIDENGKNIYSQPLFQDNTSPNVTSASMFYTFPQRDVYQVTIVGKPLTANAFQPFTLTWTFRVDQDAHARTEIAQNARFFSTFISIVFIGALFIGLIIYGIINTRKNKKQTTKEDEKKYEEKNSGNIY